MVEPDKSISTKVFIKQTHTDQYLNFSSNYLLAQKGCVGRTQVNKVKWIVY